MFGREPFDWSKVHLFWVDERVVPPTDPASNYKLAADTCLVRPAHIPASASIGLSASSGRRRPPAAMPTRFASSSVWRRASFRTSTWSIAGWGRTPHRQPVSRRTADCRPRDITAAVWARSSIVARHAAPRSAGSGPAHGDAGNRRGQGRGAQGRAPRRFRSRALPGANRARQLRLVRRHSGGRKLNPLPALFPAAEAAHHQQAGTDQQKRRGLRGLAHLADLHVVDGD